MTKWNLQSEKPIKECEQTKTHWVWCKLKGKAYSSAQFKERYIWGEPSLFCVMHDLYKGPICLIQAINGSQYQFDDVEYWILNENPPPIHPLRPIDFNKVSWEDSDD